MAGRPARKMPAFSRPIASRSGPRYSVWSMSMLVTTAQSASIDVDRVEPAAQADLEDHHVELGAATNSAQDRQQW